MPAEAPVYRCDYCGRPFATESYRTLHHGLAHEGVLTDEGREAFEAAYEDENASLRRFRIIALGLLVLLYFGFLFVFAVVT
ncbi:DNA-binding protein [Salinigranum rubrum]|uniref:DNA-binding protein n=1 Tax=Salinigranum rubrum TaxID=755307 RepID=A0A2I8VPT5_9EURY|nr:DNA-binding protein [Salinigranum rubrum]